MKKLFLLIILMVSCSGCALLMATPNYGPGYSNPHPCVYPCYIGNDGRYHYDVDIDDHD